MNSQSKTLKFEGMDLRELPPNAHPLAPQEPEPYIASKALITAVNLAIALRRPLLLEGDPGCGKTCLAKAVAFELGLPYFRWNVQSISKAKDGLYTYDALARLYDVQLQSGGQETQRDPGNANEYKKSGALGKAFEIKDCRSVVLIDEVDKAELDFPNDLLTVLDKPWEFLVQETGDTVRANPENLPIVLITSNKEKGNLPDAFLRRCLYHYVDFPSKDDLEKIVERHFAVSGSGDRSGETLPPDAMNAEVQDAAMTRFLELRNDGGLIKKPGTSEFLDWLQAIQRFGLGHDKSMADLIAVLTGEKKMTKDNKGRLPYPELLLKVQQDWRKFEAAT
jgi:MoxR-like ATPase